MRIDGVYIPDLIADEVAESYAGSGRVIDIKKVDSTTTATSAAATSEPSNPTLTVLWVGVITSIAGLALQTMRYMGEKKEL